MSSKKITPVCDISKKCGACQLSNMDYERQLKFKQANVVKLLKRVGRVNDSIGMDDPYFYRNKAQYAVRKTSGGSIVTGVYQSSNMGIAATDRCFLNDRKSNEIVIFIRKIMKDLKIQPFDPKRGKGTVRHILIRNGFKTGEYMVVLVCSEDSIPNENEFCEKLCERFKEIKTVVINVNRNEKMMLGAKERVLVGNGRIEDILCGKRFQISPRSFYQVNPVQTEVLYKTAADFAGLSGNETILDAYCGIGTIGISVSEKAKKIIGVEINADAVNDAKVNAERNGIKNAVYYNLDAAAFMKDAAEEKVHFDTAFVDPPRAGCSKIFLSALTELSPDKIVYVSCNPQTLARDLYFLIHNGYKVGKIQPVDMFPHTSHVETVVLMSRSLTEHEKYGEYFMNRSVSDIMSEYSEQHDEWH